MKQKSFWGPDEDRYGFAGRFRRFTNEELVKAFNREVGNPGWGGARADYLSRLHQEFLSRDLDCSAFLTKGSMSLRHRIMLIGKVLIPIPVDPQFSFYDLNLN